MLIYLLTNQKLIFNFDHMIKFYVQINVLHFRVINYIKFIEVCFNRDNLYELIKAIIIKDKNNS